MPDQRDEEQRGTDPRCDGAQKLRRPRAEVGRRVAGDENRDEPTPELGRPAADELFDAGWKAFASRTKRYVGAADLSSCGRLSYQGSDCGPKRLAGVPLRGDGEVGSRRR